MIAIGRYQGTIKENSLKATMGGKAYVNIVVDINGDLMDCKIWLTNKCIHSGQAQAQLMKCGFDYDKRELSEIEADSKLLAGIRIPVSVTENEYNGQTSLQCNIELNSVDSGQVSKLQEMLRKQKPVDKDGPTITDEDIPF